MEIWDISPLTDTHRDGGLCRRLRDSWPEHLSGLGRTKNLMLLVIVAGTFKSQTISMHFPHGVVPNWALGRG